MSVRQADGGVEWTRFPIARLRYAKATGVWSLYWRDRNLRLHEYDFVSATASIEDLLTEVDRDPTAIFWADFSPVSSGRINAFRRMVTQQASFGREDIEFVLVKGARRIKPSCPSYSVSLVLFSGES